MIPSVGLPTDDAGLTDSLRTFNGVISHGWLWRTERRSGTTICPQW
jgi:hypothetical protein